jgi:signal transduction histidine kinase
MAASEVPPADAVTDFLREIRHKARENARRLQCLSESREAAERRLTGLRERVDPAGLVNLVDEMTVRDEELTATTDELGEQLDSLRRASALLERERCKYMDLFEHAPDAYIVTTMAGVIDEANVAAGTLFRSQPAFLTGRPLITFVARNDTRTFRSFLTQLQSSDQNAVGNPHQAMLRMRPRGQPVFVIFARTTPVMGGGGRPIALRWMLRQFDLDEAQTGKGAAVAELASAIAEDLRDPLVPIATWARSLREGGARDEEEARQALDWIERSAQVQQAKLDELAEFANAYREPAEVEVTDIADDVERAVRAEGGEWSRFVFHRLAAPGEGRVIGQGLSRAIELLLRRALEATPRQSQIHVRVRVQGREAFVDIETPEGSRVPRGWAIRTATATRIVDRCGGHLVMGEPSATVRVCLPRLTARPRSDDELPASRDTKR